MRKPFGYPGLPDDLDQPYREYRRRMREMDELLQPPTSRQSKPKRKTRSDKGQSQVLSPDETDRARSYYSGLLDDDLRKWRRPTMAAKYITTEFLKRPEGSWQTIKRDVVLPVLERRGLIQPKT
jgi:hypothetical protein